MINVDRMLGKMIGRPKPPFMGLQNMTNKQYKMRLAPKADWDGDGVPNIKDCRPFDKNRDMVKYNYFEAEDESGKKDVVYAGSKLAVKRIGEDHKLNYVAVREMPYKEAQEKLGASGSYDIRNRYKQKYTNIGTKKVSKKR